MKASSWGASPEDRAAKLAAIAAGQLPDMTHRTIDQVVVIYPPLVADGFNFIDRLARGRFDHARSLVSVGRVASRRNQEGDHTVVDGAP